MCGPLCTFGIVGGLSLSKLLGINDLTLGIWVGALILSASLLFFRFLSQKKVKVFGGFATILGLFYILSFAPLYKYLIWQSPKICGMPRVILGSLVGMFILFFSDWVNHKIIAKHNNKVYFYYQKAIVPLLALVLVSVIIEVFIC
ncbi:MAG: hypothetical protein PHD96_00020 [Candidatus Pacebacteria bacterium]|jgi:hypothetical protein|nr:hypothetical protein [Candidatus Paceibacterota bacterium]